ncbi:MAG: chromosomal replication initiator protein DnaA [Candidatus Kapabacteria bacterium]|nr:chromosomal replication initiator protein DnaA [Candidatus Kapabacteria bacterium]MDW7996094.1 chromosomal replication initiator protein DnaA [Bacteroidota bacterium]MDW8224453.1 chromosomal replication initiator protein DnaA [Bacteroidota bacterium]
MPRARRPLELFPEWSPTTPSAKKAAQASGTSAPETLWERFLQLIRDNVPPQVFKTWFEPLRFLRWENTTLTVQVPSQFFCEWLEEHYYGLLQRALVQVFGAKARLEYDIMLDRGVDTQQRTVRLPALRTPPLQQPLPLHPTPAHIPISPINPRYTFERFVSGTSNSLAYSAARSIASQPGQTRFNPLLIYGGIGLGKTHLVQAIHNYLLQRRLPLRLVYVSSEYFTTGYITALQHNRAHEFTAFYTNADVLIIDDIQFLSGKEKTQQHFFHIFNALHQAGKQLVFTSDKPPRDLTDLDERLVSRLQWGLVAEIQPPEYELRLEILRRKSIDEGLEVPEEVLRYIAHHVTRSIRELEGCLIHLLARVTLDHCEITTELAQESVATLVQSPSRELSDAPYSHPLAPERILAAVARYYRLDVPTLTGKTRKREVAQARHLAMYLLRSWLKLSLKTIGDLFGGRDHTTVLHACETIEQKLPNSPTLRQAVSVIEQTLTPSIRL